MSHVKAKLYGSVTFPALNSGRLFAKDGHSGTAPGPCDMQDAAWPTPAPRAGRPHLQLSRTSPSLHWDPPAVPPPVQQGGTGRLGRATDSFQAHSKSRRSPQSLSLQSSDPPQHCMRLGRRAHVPAALKPWHIVPLCAKPAAFPATRRLHAAACDCLPDMTYLNQNPTRGISTWHYSRDRPSSTNFSNIAISGAPAAPKLGFQHPSSACGENASLQPSPSDGPASAGSFSF